MKKLMFVLAMAFCMIACNGNGCSSECAKDSISTDSVDTIAADSVDSIVVDSASADSL